MSSYRVAPIFLIRLAGVPFEALRSVGSAETVVAAREVLEREQDLSNSAVIANHFLDSRSNSLPPEAFRALRSAVRSRRPLSKMAVEIPREIQSFDRAAIRAEAANTRFNHCLVSELITARRSLLEAAGRFLPHYLVFGAAGSEELLSKTIGPDSSALVPRNKRTRERERHLLLYLQRIAAKNDTFSEFGPASWGRIDTSGRGISWSGDGKITRREAFLERWTAHTIADAINRDAEARPELAPRIHPNGRLEESSFIIEDTATEIRLSERSLEILRKCDGNTPAHQVPATLEELADLADRGFLKWELEVQALDPYSVETLLSSIGTWRKNPVRARWMERIRTLTRSPQSFEAASDVEERKRIMAVARESLMDLGAAKKPSYRSLYAALNPIAEECFHNSEFSIGEQVIDQVASEAALWIDLWRDTYAFVASRVALGLRELLAQVAPRNGIVSLPRFLNYCAKAHMSLTGPGLVVLAATAFREVKEIFLSRISDDAHLPSFRLTREHCHVVRENFEFEKFDEYTYPSADLQLSARSATAVEESDFEWILGELHPPVALLHHGAYWSCPDLKSLSEALTQTVFGRPSAHFGVFAADFTAHTSVHYFDALPNLTNFVAPQRPHPTWRWVAPAEVEVFVEKNGDVAMRHRVSHEYLGSFARAWIIPLGFHPFHFGMSPHAPRLLCGNVIVQRRAWTIGEKELRPGNFNGVSRDLVLAIEELRAARDLPRYVYIRPTERALRRSGAEGRDKDTKPVFIDLESYLFLEIFHRWLKKAGEIEVTEMLPDPDHLCWKELDGRRTFELRTLIVPRA